jgi:hypothetical protein
MRLLLTLLLAFATLEGQQKPRVFLISLDGLGYQAFSEDPAATELRTLKKLASEGIYAPMQAAFPSLTAPGHASIFTGAYGNTNGITSNTLPNGTNGFRAEQLRTEMFWVKAARSGVRTVAHNPTQGFPCNQFNSGPNVVLMNGYQTAEVSPQKLLQAKDVEWLPQPPPGFAQPNKSNQPIKYFRYTSGRIQFAAAIFAKSTRYDTIRISAQSGKRYVDAALKDAESIPVRLNNNPARPLARYFSEALPISNITAVHFRLFDLTTDATNFLLYQSEAKELSVCQDGDQQATRFKERLLTTAGAFIGNGAGRFYEQGSFGPIHTDGLAERRWLETLELHARQTMRHSRALLSEFSPRVLVDYISTPDDMLHTWWPQATQSDKFNEPYRRWGYQIIDWRIEQLKQSLKPEDHFLIVSDHGMSAMHSEVRLNTLLKDLGFEGRIQPGPYYLRSKDKALLEEAKQKLSQIKDGETLLFKEWFWPTELNKYGIGGDNGGDLYNSRHPQIPNTSRSPRPPPHSPRSHGPLHRLRPRHPIPPRLHALHRYRPLHPPPPRPLTICIIIHKG